MNRLDGLRTTYLAWRQLSAEAGPLAAIIKRNLQELGL